MEWNALSTDELKNTLDELEEDLDEVNLEKTMVLGQRGHHTSSKKIIELCKGFEEKIMQLDEKISSIEDELKRRAQ